MSRIAVASIAFATWIASCTSPRDSAFDGASGSERAAPRDAAPLVELRPNAPSDGPHFRVETVIFELPVPIAEELYGRAADRESTLGTSVDGAKCREALDVLAPANPAIVRVARPDVVAGIAELARIPARAASQIETAGSRASDFLALDVRVMLGQGWTPTDLEVRIQWSDAHGRVLARLPRSTSPLPEGEWLQIVCLPPASAAANQNLPALFVFLRAATIRSP